MIKEELAQPKEYLNDKFKLVVTNMLQDGWILVPDGAEFLTPDLFWKDGDMNHLAFGSSSIGWYRGALDLEDYLRKQKYKILWQRNPKQEEQVMNTEKKGRFLHQEWYEAFGRGEDVEYTSEKLMGWRSVGMSNCFDVFNHGYIKFRLKPQTMQIGSRTINKPISVKPEIGQEYYMPSLSNSCKYSFETWSDNNYDKEVFNRNLCHITADDAVKMTDALLSLMK